MGWLGFGKKKRTPPPQRDTADKEIERDVIRASAAKDPVATLAMLKAKGKNAQPFMPAPDPMQQLMITVVGKMLERSAEPQDPWQMFDKMATGVAKLQKTGLMGGGGHEDEEPMSDKAVLGVTAIETFGRIVEPYVGDLIESAKNSRRRRRGEPEPIIEEERPKRLAAPREEEPVKRPGLLDRLKNAAVTAIGPPMVVKKLDSLSAPDFAEWAWDQAQDNETLGGMLAFLLQTPEDQLTAKLRDLREIPENVPWLPVFDWIDQNEGRARLIIAELRRIVAEEEAIEGETVELAATGTDGPDDDGLPL